MNIMNLFVAGVKCNTLHEVTRFPVPLDFDITTTTGNPFNSSEIFAAGQEPDNEYIIGITATGCYHLYGESDFDKCEYRGYGDVNNAFGKITDIVATQILDEWVILVADRGDECIYVLYFSSDGTPIEHKEYLGNCHNNGYSLGSFSNTGLKNPLSIMPEEIDHCLYFGVDLISHFTIVECNTVYQQCQELQFVTDSTVDFIISRISGRQTKIIYYDRESCKLIENLNGETTIKRSDWCDTKITMVRMGQSLFLTTEGKIYHYLDFINGGPELCIMPPSNEGCLDTGPLILEESAGLTFTARNNDWVYVLRNQNKICAGPKPRQGHHPFTIVGSNNRCDEDYLRNVISGSKDSCGTLCALNTRCTAFTFDNSDGACHLHACFSHDLIIPGAPITCYAIL